VGLGKAEKPKIRLKLSNDRVYLVITKGVPNKDSCTEYKYRMQDSSAGHLYRIPDTRSG
jgi:hypothetical protein